MRTALGISLIIIGVILGLWLGVWVCLIGGIIQVINAIMTTPVEAIGIAVGLARIACATIVGWLSAMVCIGCGLSILK